MGLFDVAGSGLPLRIAASDYNAHQQAARQSRYREQAGKEFRPREYPTTVAKIQNTTGTAILQGEIIGLGSAMFLPEDNLEEFQAQLKFEGVATVAETHRHKFGIALEPIGPDDVGSCVVAGCCFAKIHVLGPDEVGDFGLVEDASAILAGSDSGGCRILWVEDKAVPEQDEDLWAYVRIIDGGAESDRTCMPTLLVTSTLCCDGDLEVGYTCFNFVASAFATEDEAADCEECDDPPECM